MRYAALAVGILLAAIGGMPALACTETYLPPGPTLPENFSHSEIAAARENWANASRAAVEIETKAAMLAHQRRLWADADLIFIARVERLEPIAVDGWLKADRVWVTPLRWLRGSGAGDPVGLAYTSASTCGPSPRYDVLAGKPGENFVLFFRGGAPGQSTLLDGVAPSHVSEPNLAALLVALGR